MELCDLPRELSALVPRTQCLAKKRCTASGTRTPHTCCADAAADAASGPAKPEAALQEVVVTGIRANLEKSLQDKKLAPVVMDVIDSTELGRFPDADVADSLAHLDCTMDRSYEAFSHTIMVGLIGSVWINPRDLPPLLYHGGVYTQMETAAERAERFHALPITARGDDPFGAQMPGNLDRQSACRAGCAVD